MTTPRRGEHREDCCRFDQHIAPIDCNAPEGKRPVRARHIVRTAHIQGLIVNAQELARRVDGVEAGTMISLEDGQRPGNPEALVEHAICKAVADLCHAAAELEEERLSCHGWSQ